MLAGYHRRRKISAFWDCQATPMQAMLEYESYTLKIGSMMGTIELYSLDTPNGQKIGIALEEMKLPYSANVIDIRQDDQFSSHFVGINPNSKIPAIVDPDGPGGKPISIFESGAILMYLAEKTGKFLPSNPTERWQTIQWLFFQMAGVGPMFGQFGHFFRYAKDKCEDPYPVERYTKEVLRLLAVIEKQLTDHKYIINNEYTITDMAVMPWVVCLDEFYEATDFLGLENFPQIQEWVELCLMREATRNGMTICPFPQLGEG